MEIENNSLISVIIPLYNAEKYIEETIQSVIEQTYTNWEILVVDDCSTDKSIEIVQKFEQYDTRIRLIVSDINFGGPARPRNIGIENAKGEYIAFLDSDDVWMKEKLEKQIDYIKKHKSIDILYTLANTIDEDSKKIGILNNQNIYNKLKYFCNDLTILYFSNYININTVLMRKDSNMYFNEDKNLIALEDWMYWINNIHKGKSCHLLNNNLISYRIVSSSISNRSSDKSYRKAYVLFSILFLNKKISFLKFIIACIVNSFRIFSKRYLYAKI